MIFHNRTKTRQQLRMRTVFESLENRTVMDVAFGLDFVAAMPERGTLESPPAVFDLTCEVSVDSNNVLTIHGGMARDRVSVSDQVTQGLVKINVRCGSGVHTPWIFPQGELSKVVFFGGAGNDMFANNTSIPSEAYGEAGNDMLIGGPGADELHGGTGNDLINGNGAWVVSTIADKLYGGAHDDIILGGQGDDLMYGGGGNDSLQGGSGDDQMFGGTGLDELQGQAGDDFLHGGYDNQSDLLTGGSGNDTFIQQWRKQIGNGRWIITELETVTDYAFGDTLDWREDSLSIIPWNPMF